MESPSFVGDILAHFSSITLLFIGVILVGTFLAHKNFNAKAIDLGPTILTTFGIFATFVGIASGLFEFNTNDIQGSVPKLLDGMKTAIWASAFGVGGALTLKFRFAFWGLSSKYATTESHGASIDDLVNKMAGVQQAMVSVQQAIAGDDEGTLLGQIKLSRGDMKDRLDSLIKAQKEFAEKMAENNSKALIEALKDVMRDFNAKINEQFGENFKQLNQAVERILVWQEQYRQQMTEMIEQQTKTTANMATATDKYAEITSKAEKFTQAAESLQNLISTLNTQRDHMEKSLSDLGNLLKSASGSLPEIETKIVSFAEQMSRGVQTANETAAKAVRDTAATLETAAVQFREETAKTIRTANDESGRAIRETNVALQKTVTDIGQSIAKQSESINTALERQLTDSLRSLANQLTSLSGKFVEDYTPLTDRLKEVVALAKQV